MFSVLKSVAATALLLAAQASFAAESADHVRISLCAKANLQAGDRFMVTDSDIVRGVILNRQAEGEQCWERLGRDGTSGYALGDVVLTPNGQSHASFDVAVGGHRIGRAQRAFWAVQFDQVMNPIAMSS